MKIQGDKKRSERHFDVGDQVYLKLHPFIQQSVASRSNQKLALRYFGPYKMLARVGSVAYRLQPRLQPDPPGGTRISAQQACTSFSAGE
jgi:hypothetical protein